MTHYSESPEDVRVDFFKPSGKWYTTLLVKWISTPGSTWVSPESLYEEFRNSVNKAVDNRFQGMTAVCLDPYHPQAHPLMWIDIPV